MSIAQHPIGSTLVNRFRSANEFIPHAVWLMTDETMDRANCECKYCAKKPQRVVTQDLDLPSSARRTSSIPSSPSKNIRRHREVRKPKPYAHVRHMPKPIKTSRAAPDQALVPERDQDIRYLLVSGRESAPRWHRKHELVWCALNPPIRGELKEECIQFWPGIVERVDLHADAVGKEGESVAEGLSPPPSHTQTRQSSSFTESPFDGEGPQVSASADGAPDWDVRQWYSYNVKFLAVTHACAASDKEVLPYLAYTPPEDLVSRLQDILPQTMQSRAEEMGADLTRVSAFNPAPNIPPTDGPAVEDPVRFREAIIPYSLAIQIASSVAGYWSPTDEWDCKFTIPTDTAPPPPSQDAPSASQAPAAGMTLHALMNQAAENNAVDVSTRATAQTFDPDGLYRPSNMTDAEWDSTRTRALGARPPGGGGGPRIVSQTRYQGLWWGAERIWTDELVRLKLARCQFAPAGSDVFYPPAGPSASTRARMRDAGYAEELSDTQSGAAEKGLFMRLDGLFVVEIPREDGSGATKECRACGQLYELADEGWEDPMEVKEPQPPSQANGKGKGKERATDVEDVVSLEGPSFMPGPSPLRPPPLPNPDPTMPIEDTAQAVLAQTTQGLGKKPRTVGGQLSHPANSVPYPLPPPPNGFKFRRIHGPGHEVVLSLSLISGRYYPGLLEHPLMKQFVQQAFDVAPQDGGLENHRHIWAMEGLISGIHQSMEPVAWRPSRGTMFKEADAESRSHFTALWDEVKQAREQVDLTQFLNADAMDVEMRQ